jgi:hypothetical protein
MVFQNYTQIYSESKNPRPPPGNGYFLQDWMKKFVIEVSEKKGRNGGCFPI